MTLEKLLRIKDVSQKKTGYSMLLNRTLIQDNPLGFSKARLGAHSVRSIMFLEMRGLVRAMPLKVTNAELTKAIIKENVLEKPTLSTRKKSQSPGQLRRFPFLHS